MPLVFPNTITFKIYNKYDFNKINGPRFVGGVNLVILALEQLAKDSTKRTYQIKPFVKFICLHTHFNKGQDKFVFGAYKLG